MKNAIGRKIQISLLETVLGSLVLTCIGAGLTLIPDHYALSALSTTVAAQQAKQVDFVTTEDLKLYLQPLAVSIQNNTSKIDNISDKVDRIYDFVVTKK